jgi:hypothetical protein
MVRRGGIAGKVQSHTRHSATVLTVRLIFPPSIYFVRQNAFASAKLMLEAKILASDY